MSGGMGGGAMSGGMRGGDCITERCCKWKG